MALSSGLPFYEYACRTLPFKVPNPYPSGHDAIGISGILLEQAQFVITAEIRRRTKSFDSALLLDFFVYTNEVITPSGGYEPKSSGTTLDNLLNPGYLGVVDNISDTRDALEFMFRRVEPDTNFSAQQLLADWLQNAYPQSASGFYTDEFNQTGHYRHRFPSETGNILYNSDEVLGSSGVLYDIDFGEVMFNPYPYMALSSIINTHGPMLNNSDDPYYIIGGPVFPAFQRTDGNLIDLTGREPHNTPLALNYDLTLPINSGALRLDGYTLVSGTIYNVGLTLDISSQFSFLSDGIRQVLNAGNLDTGRVYVRPTVLVSGVYRVGGKNRRVTFPNTAVESGTISTWPPLGSPYYLTNNTMTPRTVVEVNVNNGYHVFDSTIWITDRTLNVNNPSSGLTVLSPWTAHKLWLRCASLASGSIGEVWGQHHGLIRTDTNSIFRAHSYAIADTVTPFLQTYTLHKYDDNLDYLGDFTSDGNPNAPTESINSVEIRDVFWDGNHYFLTGSPGASGLVELDGAFQYVTSWACVNNELPVNGSGTGTRGFYSAKNNKYYFYGPGIFSDFDMIGGFTMHGSGIIEFAFTGGPNRVTIQNMKFVRGEKPFGGAIPFGNQLWRYHDIIEVPDTSPHLIPGIYAIVSIVFSDETDFVNYVMRIEERSDYWEVMSCYKLDSGSSPEQDGGFGTVDALFMDI